MAFRTHEEEGALDTMSLDEFLVENRKATFMLRVRGDSMKDAGIMAGDMILVDRSKSPKIGDIVISVEGGSFTMRFLERKETAVEAVVVAVIRKYA